MHSGGTVDIVGMWTMSVEVERSIALERSGFLLNKYPPLFEFQSFNPERYYDSIRNDSEF
jgi:hypothetical protein